MNFKEPFTKKKKKKERKRKKRKSCTGFICHVTLSWAILIPVTWSLPHSNALNGQICLFHLFCLPSSPRIIDDSCCSKSLVSDKTVQVTMT